MDALVKTKFKIIVRPHPQTVQSEKAVLNPLMEKYKEVEWNFDNDNLSVMNRADVLISDFSGIMNEFAILFNRPVIYRDPEKRDNSVYDEAWLDHEKWTFQVVKKYAVRFSESDFPNFKELILSALNNSDIANRIQEVRNECWENVGIAAKLVVDYLTRVENVDEQEK